MSYFEKLGLAKPILQALAKTGYDTPTPIQEQAIPALLEGKDLCGIAQTGTGKTAAFSLPSLHHFATNIQPTPHRGCRMLVLSPTRELAAQIAENIRGYARFLALDVQCVFGGVPVSRQKKKLARGADILVATPGRLLDLIEQRALQLDDVEIFVLDEADQMMDMGFIHALKQIDRLLPKKRQSLFFSATMPKAIAQLGSRFLTDPVEVSVTPQATTAERVEQYITFVNQREKQALLSHMLKTEEIERALIFMRTKHGADRVVRHLSASGIEARAIHGNKSQGQRTAAMQDFRSGKVTVLVATDIAARGIDVPGVSHVFNFELPNVPEQYVHRIGRTARAGADGAAHSFCADDEREYLRDIERLTKIKLKPTRLPEGFRAMVENLPKPKAAPKSEGGGRGRFGGRGEGRGRGRPGRGQAGQSRSSDRRDRDFKPRRNSGDGNRAETGRNAESGQNAERRGDGQKPKWQQDNRSNKRPANDDRKKRNDQKQGGRNYDDQQKNDRKFRDQRDGRRGSDSRDNRSSDNRRDHRKSEDRKFDDSRRDGTGPSKRRSEGGNDNRNEEKRRPENRSHENRSGSKSGKPKHKRGGPPTAQREGNDGKKRNYARKRSGGGGGHVKRAS